MKRVCFLLVFAWTLILFPAHGNAGIIGTVDLKMSYSSPTGSVTFPTGSGTYYLDYDASINGRTSQEIFCVENAAGSTATQKYTLFSINKDLSGFGLANYQRYQAAAWIAEYYFQLGNTATDAEKAAAQIAVWEIIFDGLTSKDLSSGSFKASTSLNSMASAILNQVPTSYGDYQYTPWALAVSPPYDGTPIVVEPYQNYLVRVPEPSAVFFFGTGLIGLIGYRRKMRMK